MSKGHIAFYIGSFQRGGAERVMANLAEYFYTQDYQVTLVTTYLAEEEYPFAHAAWKRIPLSERGVHPQAEEVMLLDESPALVDPFGGAGRDGIRRVFSGLLPDEQTSNRAANIARRSAKLRRVFEKIRPDVIVSFLGKNNVMAILTTIGLGIPVLVHAVRLSAGGGRHSADTGCDELFPAQYQRKVCDSSESVKSGVYTPAL